MRILAITNLYPNPYQPHRATFNRHQFRLLGQKTPLHVIAPIAWTDAKKLNMTWPQGRRVTLDGLTIDHPVYYFPPKFARGFYGHCMRWSLRRTFAKAVSDFRPDIVFAPWAYPDGWAAVRLARQYNLPAVIQVHGSDVKLLGDFPARRRRTVDAVTMADGVVAVSDDLAKDLVSLGVPRSKVLVNYDGIDPALFHPGDRAAAKAKLNLTANPVVLFVGNLVAVKAVDRLLTAVANLPVTTVIVGDGPLRAALETQAKSLALDVRFTGSVPFEQLPDYYRAADVFVLPSLSEGVPNVLLEASACGTPWVASDVGGIAEIAHLGRSTRVPSGDIAALENAICDTLANTDEFTLPPQRLRTEAVDDLFAFLQSVISPN